MPQPRRLGPREVRKRMEAGALLVSAYEDDAAFGRIALEGAIPFGEFRRRKASLPRDHEIFFY